MSRLTLRAILAALILTVLAIATDANAYEDLPATLIAQLAMKVASYDKHQAERQRTRPRILVVDKASDERSVRVATAVANALRDPDVGKGAPVEVIAFSSAMSLAASVDDRAASIVILATGLEDTMASIAGALSGKDVLTMGTTGVLADRGAVIGFELRESKPKIVVNLTSAKNQNAVMKSELLALARIVP